MIVLQKLVYADGAQKSDNHLVAVRCISGHNALQECLLERCIPRSTKDTRILGAC